jgi:hypothetical protein
MQTKWNVPVRGNVTSTKSPLFRMPEFSSFVESSVVAVPV